jgi:acyl carrier protein
MFGKHLPESIRIKISQSEKGKIFSEDHRKNLSKAQCISILQYSKNGDFIKEWDSMNYLLFIAELEKEYNVSFSMDEVMGATCLGDIRIALEKKQ